MNNKKVDKKIHTQDLFVYDQKIRAFGYEYLAGIDEAGRGALAGPVVAAAVVFARDTYIEGVRDSKKLSSAQRLELYYQIRQKAISYSVGIVPPAEIDQINILQATFRAMQQAVEKLKIKPDFVLIDGRDKPLIGYSQQAVVKGDDLSFSIAAASIIAKVTRDKIMNFYDRFFPQYGFLSHKGYATAKHIAAIEEVGRSKIHRFSFRLPSEKESKQITLF